jgi:uncharacterized protein (TIGR00251 family)
MIQVTEHAEGCILPVRAQPAAKKTSVVGDYNGALKIAVTSPPENGRANDAVVEALRDSLGLKRSQISLIIGQTSRDKKFLIRGMSKPELESLLLALVPGL